MTNAPRCRCNGWRQGQCISQVRQGQEHPAAGATDQRFPALNNHLLKQVGFEIAD